MADVWLPRAQYVESLPKATSYACLFFTDPCGSPLQLRSTRQMETWQIPGGNTDPGESPWQTALRECREETGLDMSWLRPRLLLTHFIGARADWPYPHIGFIFDGGVLTEDQLSGIVLDPEEHIGWSVRTVSEWGAEMAPPTFRRLRAIDGALRSGVPGYLQTDGVCEPLGPEGPAHA